MHALKRRVCLVQTSQIYFSVLSLYGDIRHIHGSAIQCLRITTIIPVKYSRVLMTVTEDKGYNHMRSKKSSIVQNEQHQSCFKYLPPTFFDYHWYFSTLILHRRSFDTFHFISIGFCYMSSWSCRTLEIRGWIEYESIVIDVSICFKLVHRHYGLSLTRTFSAVDISLVTFSFFAWQRKMNYNELPLFPIPYLSQKHLAIELTSYASPID